uniref:Uncharacterized protein n=1 Tax=viral metagenome TaxID=1070528 RepID=A0A6C0BJ58_9ZZZZ
MSWILSWLWPTSQPNGTTSTTPNFSPAIKLPGTPVTDVNNISQKFHLLSDDELNGIMTRLHQLESMVTPRSSSSTSSSPSFPIPKIPQPLKNAFQEELKSKIAKLRINMGTSHGFGPEEVRDLIELQKSMCL